MHKSLFIVELGFCANVIIEFVLSLFVSAECS
jgi:hypothetical protein